MLVTNRAALRRLGGTALAVATVAVVSYANPAYAADTPPAKPAPAGTAAPAPTPSTSASPAPSTAPSTTPTTKPAPGTGPDSKQPVPVPGKPRAADNGGDLAVSLKAGPDDANGTFSTVVVSAHNNGPETAKDALLVVTLHQASGRKATWVNLPANCADILGFKTSCKIGDVPNGQDGGPITLQFRLSAGPTKDTGTITAVAAGENDPNAANNVAELGFTVAPAAAAKLAANADDRVNVVPGTVTTVKGVVTNVGDTPSGPVKVTMTIPTGTSMSRSGTCTVTGARTVVCSAGSLQPGGTYTITIPVTVGADLGGRTLTGGTLSAVETSAGGVSASDTYVIRTTVRPVADLAVTVASTSVKSARTARIPLNMTFTNRGPSTAVSPTVRITAPTGTKFAYTPRDCTAEIVGKRLRCPLPSVAPGSRFNGHLELVYTGGKTAKDGIVAITSTTPDPLLANNTVKYSVTVDGVPVTTGSPTPNPPGSLPVTGAKAGLIGGAGAALLLAGGALVLVTRRRKVATVTAGESTEGTSAE